MAATKKILVERVIRHLSNGFASDDLTLTNNEVWLYCLDAIAKVSTQRAREGWAMEQVWEIPEGLSTRLKFTSFLRDNELAEYSITLPQLPIGLPLGVSILDVYLAGKRGRSKSFYPIKANRAAYFQETVKGKTDAYYYLLGTKLSLVGIEMLGITDSLYVVMQSVKDETTGDNTPLNMPDDMINDVFLLVVNLVRTRYNLPQDNNNDGLDKRTP